MRFIIAKEGLPFVLVFGISCFLSYWFNNLTGFWHELVYYGAFIPLLVITIFLLIFFRDPPRHPQGGYKPGISILSPADGSIIAVEQEEGNTAIYVEMHLRNVHVTRVPFDAKIKNVTIAAGKYYAIYYIRPQPGKQAEAITKNARVIIELEDAQKQITMYNMICGKLARRARPFVKIGDTVKAGERMGIIMFGSMVRIVLPGTKYKMIAKLGQNVYGAKTILCEKTQ
jgi:phosphatidylserine decarboxylase